MSHTFRKSAALATAESHTRRWRERGVTPGGTKFSCTQSLADHIEGYRRALRAGELAELLSISRITIFKLAKAGRIPSFRVGTCARFDPRALAKWLRNM